MRGTEGKCFRTPQRWGSQTPTTSSEPKVSSQLYDALPAYSAGDKTCVAIGKSDTGIRPVGWAWVGTVANVRIGIGVVNMIERVKRVGLDFQTHRFTNGKLLCEAEVHIREMRPDQRVASGIAKGPVGRVGVRRWD